MYKLKSLVFRAFQRIKLLFGACAFFALFTQNAFAVDLDRGILGAFNLSKFVPLVLESMMDIATSLYNFFVGNGTGLIYILIYLFLGFYIGLYLVKMYLPRDWLGFFGFSEGGEMWDGKATGWTIAENVLKPCIRAIIAIVVLLQIKPIYVTEWVVNPFLEFGSIYTTQVLKTTNIATNVPNIPECPASLDAQGWITKSSCDFLVQPVHVISYENNRIIKYGFDFLKTGLRGMLTLVPRGGENFLNIITGFLLISAFMSSNLFMALLIIQAIFDFCLSLIMYPFNVLAWVARKSDKWFDILPPFSQIIESLKKLVITMIACAFILCINVAVVRAIFNWSSSVFNVAAGGTASTNFPSITNAGMHFGGHFMLWLSSLLTFFLMQHIFKLTRERLDMYTQNSNPKLYNNLKNDAGNLWGKVKAAPDKIKTIAETVKKFKG